MDLEDVKAAMPKVVPFVGTLGITYEEMSPTSARLRLANDPALHNHVGGLHAGALFTLGESASGAVVVAAFGNLLGDVTPLVANAVVRYDRVAKGDVVATATLDREPASIAADLDRAGTTRFPVDVELSRADGTVASSMTVYWVLRKAG